MKRAIKFLALLMMLVAPLPSAFAQQAGQAQITWEIANRFRLFAEQKDFDLQVAAWQSGTTASKSILDTEHALEKPLGGSGWSSKVGRLCYDRDAGRLLTKCSRDNVSENYLNPDSHLIILRVALPPQFSTAQCTWTIGDTATGKLVQQAYKGDLTGQRVPEKKPTPVHVVARNTAGQTLAGDITITARDYLIVGLGDSIASGEGNPDQPIQLSDTGFCFKRVLSPIPQFYLPGRAKATVAGDCVDENRKIANCGIRQRRSGYIRPAIGPSTAIRRGQHSPSLLKIRTSASRSFHLVAPAQPFRTVCSKNKKRGKDPSAREGLDHSTYRHNSMSLQAISG